MKSNSFFLSCMVLLTMSSGCATSGNLSSSLSLSSTSALAEPLAAGILSGEFAKSLDNISMKKALRAEYIALEKGRSGSPVAWTGSSDFSGKVIPQQPYQVGSTDCRRYVHILHDRGTEKQAIGTACRNQKGGWVPLK